MSKEDELMAFLHERVFDPVLSSPTSSQSLKSGVQLTINRMRQRDAAGMIHFFWSAVSGTERSTTFAKLMKDGGFTRFEEVLEEFRDRFNEKWLRR